MLKQFLLIFAVILVGPLVSYLVVLSGCYGQNPVLGVLCGHNAYMTMFGISFVIWLMAIFGLSFMPDKKRKK